MTTNELLAYCVERLRLSRGFEFNELFIEGNEVKMKSPGTMNGKPIDVIETVKSPSHFFKLLGF